MELIEIIRHRRSVRKFKDQPLKKRAITQIVEAGRWAPSGLNNQPWKFLVLSDGRFKEGLAEFSKYGRIIREAPCAIVVCLDLEASYHRDKDLMATGAAIQNMLLEIHALGLGACWLGEILNKKRDVVRYLKLRKGLELVAVLALGYPDEHPGKGSRKPLQSLMIGP